jgi:hypothetical protein
MISEQIKKKIKAGDLLELNYNCAGLYGQTTLYEGDTVIAAGDELLVNNNRVVSVMSLAGEAYEDCFSVYNFTIVDNSAHEEIVEVEAVAKKNILDATKYKVYRVQYYLVEQSEEDVMAYSEEEAIEKTKKLIKNLRDPAETILPLKDMREQKVIAVLNNIMKATIDEDAIPDSSYYAG